MNIICACALIEIRESIVRGELAGGDTLSESALNARFGLSEDTLAPVLSSLRHEGLLTDEGQQGYRVRAWSDDEVIDVIDVRGALEGLAARRVAERGASAGLLAELRECLRDGDAIFVRNVLGVEDKATYADMNRRFHSLIAEESASSTLLEALARNNRQPFASPFAIAFGNADGALAHDVLRYAHRQHHAILDALAHQQGPRAEELMREHVTPTRDRLNLRRTRVSGAPPASAPESFIQSKRGVASSG